MVVEVDAPASVLVESVLVGEFNINESRQDILTTSSALRYGVTDTDGSRPDAWGYIAAYGMEEQSGRDVERFR